MRKGVCVAHRFEYGFPKWAVKWAPAQRDKQWGGGGWLVHCTLRAETFCHKSEVASLQPTKTALTRYFLFLYHLKSVYCLHPGLHHVWTPFPLAYLQPFQIGLQSHYNGTCSRRLCSLLMDLGKLSWWQPYRNVSAQTCYRAECSSHIVQQWHPLFPLVM